MLLPVLNQRARVILDSYNHLRGPVTAPLNTSAVMHGIPDAGELSHEQQHMEDCAVCPTMRQPGGLACDGMWMCCLICLAPQMI